MHLRGGYIVSLHQELFFQDRQGETIREKVTDGGYLMDGEYPVDATNPKDDHHPRETFCPVYLI